MGTTTVGDVAIGVKIDTSQLNKEMTKVKRTAQKEMKKVGKSIDKETKKASKEATKNIGTINGSIKKLIKGFVGVTAALLVLRKAFQLIKDMSRASMEFESAFAGIKKTVEATPQEFAKLSKEIRKLAKEIPVTAVELSRIGEIGGQLGIGVQDIAQFTDTVARISQSTNLTSERASIDFARIANVMQVPISEIGRMASSVVDLGNNFATMEDEILAFASRISGGGRIVGLTTADLFGIATAFTSVGIQSQLGGTAVQKTLLKINDAVNEGGKEMERFSKVAGVSSQEFAKLWDENTSEAFSLFIKGLGTAGDDASKILEELVAGDERLKRAFLSVASAGDLMSNAISTSNEAYLENIALLIESNKRFETNESRMTVVKNRWKDMGITIGDILNKVWVPAMEGLVWIVEKLGLVVRQLWNIAKLVATAVSMPFSLFGSLMIDLFQNFKNIISNFMTVSKGLLPAIWAAIKGDTSDIKNLFVDLLPTNFDVTQGLSEEYAETFDTILEDMEVTKKRLFGVSDEQTKNFKSEEQKKRDAVAANNAEIEKLLKDLAEDADTEAGNMQKSFLKALDKSIDRFDDLEKKAGRSLDKLAKKNKDTQQKLAIENSKAIKSYRELRKEIGETIREIEKQRDLDIDKSDVALGEAVVEQMQKIKDLEQELRDEQKGSGTSKELEALNDIIQKEKKALADFLEDNKQLVDEINKAKEEARKTDFQKFTETEARKQEELKKTADEEIAKLQEEVAQEKIILDEFLEANRQKSNAIQEFFNEQRKSIRLTQNRVKSFTDNYIQNLVSMGDVTETQVARVEEQLRRFREAFSNIQALQSNTSFAEGGYTGDGGVFEPAGTVHKGEYVVPQSMVASMPNLVEKLEGMRTGNVNKEDNSINMGDVSFQNQFDLMDFFRKKNFLRI